MAHNDNYSQQWRGIIKFITFVTLEQFVQTEYQYHG